MTFIVSESNAAHKRGRATLLPIESPEHFQKWNESHGRSDFSLELVVLAQTYINEVCINVV